ncbi:MAG: UDP-N-acetylmuramoyl-L-alanyl-D-glutamate--2,6-diaminopimelate ligase [Patescibacteria group bacterium]|nr:UDP-N-acetylmuramoyl-L-alanyl-D-glutamate--2,6-diaminopimelate ligase [Patescibacteria group bacterium]
MRSIKSLIPQKFINHFKHLPLAFLALTYYHFPGSKLKIIGVTGTDGKTTTVNLIYEILQKAGLRVAMISTVSAKIGLKEIDTGFHVTAPNPWLLQKLLKTMVDQGIEIVVLEATSHGLDQFRLFGINYEIGVLTNVTHEHLDYHKTMKNYLEAKAKLFSQARVAVLNRDDESYDYLVSRVKKAVSYGIKNEADYTPKSFPFKTSLPGGYNQYNCLAAIAATRTFGIEKKIIFEALENFRGVIGRAEEINEGQAFRALVDFAHTPNALKEVLTALRGQLKDQGKLIAVFGSAGLRDKTKRPLMGEVAGKLADLVILTAEDPRTEKVPDICEEIAEGCRRNKVEPKIILDRASAIKFAVERAEKDDIVVVCGKGHERSMCFGNKEYPWSDQEEMKEAISKLAISN